MEKIEVPQAIYDEFMKASRHQESIFEVGSNVRCQETQYPNLSSYLFGNVTLTDDKNTQLNLAKVIAGEAEFVPIEEAYYWQDIQGWWLGYANRENQGKITVFGLKINRSKLTETEIRDKTSFDIDKLERK